MLPICHCRRKQEILEDSLKLKRPLLDRHEWMGNYWHRALQRWLKADAHLEEGNGYFCMWLKFCLLYSLNELNSIINDTILILYAIFCLSSWYFNFGRNFSVSYHWRIRCGHFFASSRKQRSERKFVTSNVKFISFPNSNFVFAIQWISRIMIQNVPIR